jgi:hypothetical protein
MRHLHFHLPTRLNDARPFGKLMPITVNLDIDHAFLGGQILGQLDFRGGRRCIAHGSVLTPTSTTGHTRRAGRAGICRRPPNPASVLCEKFHKLQDFATLPNPLIQEFFNTPKKTFKNIKKFIEMLRFFKISIPSDFQLP